MSENFVFEDSRNGKEWIAKIPVRALLAKVENAFSETLVSERSLGLAVKAVFPTVKRQHVAGGPYSYYGLKQKSGEKSLDTVSLVAPCLNIQEDESGSKKPSEKLKVDAECQAVEETAYDFPPSLFSEIPKDRFLERSMLKKLEEEEIILGEGTFSKVVIMQYRKMAVAVKELKELKDFSLQNIRNRLLREAKTMLNISPHESIPVFYGVIVNSRPYSLVMQLCTRSNKCLTLLKVVRKNTERLDDLCLLRIIGKLAEALHHVHKNGFLHNDLKLDNVAVIRTYEGPTSKQWLPMILDFGEATRTKSIFKRRYNSHHNHIDPLVLRGEAKHSVESDIFSFGMILKNLATIIKGHEDAELAKRIAAECTGSHRRPSLKDISESLKKTLDQRSAGPDMTDNQL